MLHSKINFQPLVASAMYCGMSFFPCLAQSTTLHFDPLMISGDSSSVGDLSQFELEGSEPPGTYPVDIYMNGQKIANKDILFTLTSDRLSVDNIKTSDVHDSTGLTACLTKKDLVGMGVNLAPFDALNALASDKCLSPGKYIPNAYTAFNFEKMRLDISIPQAALQKRPHGWISPSHYDEGINAALFSYQFNGSEYRGNYSSGRNYYLNFKSGLNLGPWRLRNNGTYTYYNNKYSHQQDWNNLDTYAQRAIIPLRSELTLGESTTNSDIFDAFSFRGIQLGTDDDMYPDTMRGYAPEIKGIAYSHAQVSIRQNGNVIYRTFVAPGAFVINDLYPVTVGGDLELDVKEADGASRVYTIPYSSVPILQRQGHIRYTLAAGSYHRVGSDYSTPSFIQGTLLWGLPHNITTYGGWQLTDNYRAIAFGAGINLGVIGAFSADITQASSTLIDGSQHDGNSVRFIYSRSLFSTGTTLQLAGYRYSSQGFHTLDETALKGMSGWLYSNDDTDLSGKSAKQQWANYYDLHNSKRQQLQINISQHISNLGAVYFVGSRQTFWHSTTASSTLQAGFNSHLGNISYSISYNYSNINGQPRPDKALYFSLSVPIDIFYGDTPEHATWLTYSMNRDSSGTINNQAGLSGTAFDENNLNWSVSQGYGQHQGANGDVSFDYKGTYGNISAGYGDSNDYRQLRYGASGGVVLTRKELIIGQPLSTTNILISAPGATGIPVENQYGVKTDWRGYTVSPYARVYRKNRVALDISHLTDNVDIDDAVVEVIPTRGALVRADFTVHRGVRALVTLQHNGKPVPFGSIVTANEGRCTGMVGDDGQVYLSGLPQKGDIKVAWGKGAEQQCSFNYQIHRNTENLPLIQFKGDCL